MQKHSKNLIGNYLTSAGRFNGAADVMIYGGKKTTWSELDLKTRKLANALIERGIKKDDKVAFMFHNCPEFLISNYAVQRCGAIPVPVNYRFTPAEIEFQVNHSDAIAFIIEDIWLDAVQKARPALKNIKHFICAGPQCPPDMEPFEKVLDSAKDTEPDVPTVEDDVCVLCYTGGTTGFPKGVMLTYGAHLKMFEELIYSLILRIGAIPLTKEQRQRIGDTMGFPGLGIGLALMGSSFVKWVMKQNVTNKLIHKLAAKMLRDTDLLKRGYSANNRMMFPSLPMFHDASYQLAMMAPIMGNQTFIAVEGVKFDPKKVYEYAAEYKPNLMANVPTGWKMLVDYPDADKYDKSSVMFCISGAGLCSAELKKKVLGKFSGAMFLDMFGQTEMTPLVSFKLDASADNLKDRSVGQPIIETKIVDEAGNSLPNGKIGEILYRSKTMMKGYYKDEAKTNEVFRDGWFHSGDLGYLDENGEIRVVERKNECISTGGEKVFPLEVEEAIYRHPAVKNVCVIGVPDEKWGSVIRAIVQLKEGKQAAEDEIIRICDGRLAGYKKPRSIVFIEEFPLSPVGKVLRNKIREYYGKP